MNQARKGFLWILAIMALAIFFRFYDLKNAPPGLWPDEAVNGVNAIQALENNGWRVFYPENFGREGLFINIQALFVWALGHHPWVLRFPSAIFGSLTVFGLYFLVRELFEENIALFSAFFLATSFWHINFSRIGFRAIMAPFFLVWGFYFLFMGISGRPTSYGRRTSIIALAGLTFGLGFHTYIAYRVAPLIALLPLWKFYKTRQKSVCAPCAIGLFIFTAILAALPLLWYYAQNPADFLGRTSAVSIFSSREPLAQFSENFVKTTGMFNFVGDFNWRHNFAGSPELWWPVGILFLVGLWQSFKKLKWPYSFLILWFVVMILPVALSNESLPHALRAIVLIPPVMILAGIGMNLVLENIKRWLEVQKIKYLLKFLLFAFFIAIAANAYNTYFNLWAPTRDVYEAFSGDITKKAVWLNSEPQNIKKYVITDSVDKADTDGTPMSFQPVVFITDTFYPQKQAGKNIYYITLKNLAPADCSQKCEFVPIEYRPSIFRAIKQKIPSLRLDASPEFVILKN